MSDVLQDLNPKHAAALKEFRQIVGDVLKSEHDDYYLIRWLRARNFDLKKSEAMLRKHMAWRKRNDVDNILDKWEPPEVLRKYYPGGYCGFDKGGCPIFVECSQLMDVKGILMSAKKSDIIKYNILMAEKGMQGAQEQSEKVGKRVDKIVMVIPMDKWTLKLLFSQGMNVLLEVMAMAEANYPEVLKFAYIVNAPKIFPMIYNLCKPLLSEDTKKKMIIMGGNYQGRLLEDMDSDQLPQFLGGSQTDPDGDIYCKSKICQGGRVPESYYLMDKQLLNSKHAKTLTVCRGTVSCVTFEVTKPECVLNWAFQTDNYDIKFGIFHKATQSDEEKSVVRPARVNSHMVPEDGFLECSQLGFYVLKFDNSYSWVHSKKVHYTAHMTESNEDVSDLPDSSSCENLQAPS